MPLQWVRHSFARLLSNSSPPPFRFINLNFPLREKNGMDLTVNLFCVETIKKILQRFVIRYFFYFVGKEEINEVREKNDFEDLKKIAGGENEKKRRQMSEERSGKPSWLQM